MKSNKARKRNPFAETIKDIFQITWFIIYHIGKGLCYICKAPIRAIKCKFGYYKSPFYKITGIKKEDYYGGSSWNIGNDHPYIIFNTIYKLKLPLEAISIDNPSTKENSLLYYHIYKETIIVTHGFYRATILYNDKYYINRNYFNDPEEYETVYSVSEFAQMNWMQFIRPEHQHMPIKVLHSNSRYRFQGRPFDTYDSSPTGIFYRRKGNLKKIFR